MWQLGSAQFDTANMALLINGEDVPLERKPKQVLQCLMEYAPNVVSKDELMAQAWPGRVISDSALTSCVARLRTALKPADDVEIKTEHGLGYRLIAPIERLDRTPPSEPKPAPTAVPAPGTVPARAAPRRRSWAYGVAALAVGLIAMVAWQFAPRPSGSATPPSVAVLPFTNLSRDPSSSDYMAHSLHDNVLTHLAQLAGLKVISRTSMLRFQNTELALPTIAGQLGVNHILEGSFQQSDDRVRVIAQLIDAQDDSHVWAESYDRPVADLLSLQSDIAYEVAQAIGLALSPDDVERLDAGAPRDRESYDLYLQALDRWRADGTSATPLLEARSLLQRAVSEDPSFAQAWALLSRVHSMLHWFGHDTSDTRVQLAKAAADKAMDLDPKLGEAHVATGLYRATGFKDYVGSAQTYRRAVELTPNSAEAHFYLGSAYRRQQDYDKAIEHFDKAIELDPLNALYLADLGQFYAALRLPDKAKPLYDRIVELDGAAFFPRMTRAYFYAVNLGDLSLMRELLESPDADNNPDFKAFASHHLAMYESREADALTHLQAMAGDWMPSGGGGARTPTALSKATQAQRAGEPTLAEQYYEEALDLATQEAEALPEDPYALLNVAAARVGLGDTDTALRMVRRALALAPRELDPVVHCLTVFKAAVIQLHAGETGSGLDLLISIMDLPHSPNERQLGLYPELAGLDDNPRYQELLRLARMPVTQL